MAIDYSGYAQAYGGGGGASGGRMLGQGISSLINAKRAQKASNVTQGYQDILSQDFMQGNMMTMLSKDASEWDDLSGTGITNAFDSYNNWKSSLSDRDQSIAKKQGLLNPIAWKQQHDAYMGMIAPSIANKIITYQAQGNKSNSQMREWIEKKGLNSFVSSNFRDSMDPVHTQLQSWALPKVGLGQQALNLGRGLTEDWTLGGAAATGAAGLGGLAFAPQIKQKATQLFGKMGATKAGARLAPVGALALAGTAKGAVGQAAKGITGAAGFGKKGQKLAQESGEALTMGALTGIREYGKKHGWSKLLKAIVKKKGTGFAMKTAAKLGIGVMGGAATGGLGTLAMGAWAAKDIYDVAKIAKELLNE